jgi:hypothetical protein
MNVNRLAGVFCLLSSAAAFTRAEELPARYFALMEAALARVAAGEPQSNPGAMLAAAVLYSKPHARNPSHGDKRKLELALALGDRLADAAEQDTAEDKQHYEWEIHFWLDTYRLLEGDLAERRRDRWRREMEKIVRWFAAETALRIDFPRYQGPYIRTSTNHYALFASTTYLAGRVLANKEWEELGARAMHRLAAEEQTPDGYWAEFTDNGPATGYNYLTLACAALYYEHSRDEAALEALRRATDFHSHFTWPDGTPVETINGRNRHWDVSAWGHFGFSHEPVGRGYAEFLARFFQAEGLSSRNLGRIAQSALYYHEGSAAEIALELPNWTYRLKEPAGMRKSGPWMVCLSGLIDAPVDSQFTLDRQGHVSIFHQRLGLVVSGANSKHQPELATFFDKAGDRVTTIPLSSRLRMNDEEAKLALAYSTFFAEAELPPASDESLTLRWHVTEVGRNRVQQAQLNLQLCLHAGETLETAGKKVVLGEQRIELSPEEIGGVLRHHGWTLHVDPAARLVWPVFPFNPYRNGPETELRRAVGVLSVPLDVQPPAGGRYGWREQQIEFKLEAAASAD